MKYPTISKLILIVVLGVFSLSGCNFPGFDLAAGKATSVPTVDQAGLKKTATIPLTETATPAPTSTSTQTPLPTSTATSELIITLLPSAAPTNTPIAPPTNSPGATLKGTAIIEKARSALPLGGAATSLYEDGGKKSLVSTRTNTSGDFQFYGLAGGKYYLVFVWIVKASGWPCSKSSLPDAGKKEDWSYNLNNLIYYVNLQNKGDDTLVLTLSTSAFSVANNATKDVEIRLVCNRLG